jgi:cardiolipin synthase
MAVREVDLAVGARIALEIERKGARSVAVLKTGSVPSSSAKPKESRRWLKRRVPRNQLYSLAPRRTKPPRLGRITPGDRARSLIRAWWVWILLAILFAEADRRLAALVMMAVGFVLYHFATDSHPAAYELHPDFDVDSDEFRTTMAGATGMPVIDGNRVEIYNNGDCFYPAMLEAIESARVSITLEQYIFWDGEIGRRFAEALADKAREGLPVKLVLDAIGSASLGWEIFDTLARGGCEVAWFRPIHWYTLHRANLRNHRKSLIIDGRLAFTGGAGIADHWLGDARNAQEWRDIEISVAGPAVLPLQTGFVQNWLLTTGELLGGHEYFPVQTILSSPSSGAGAAGTMYLVALQCARSYIHIANPYFIPDSRIVALFANACRKGVAVKLMLAGRHNDTWWARQNSVRLYGRLLASGVHIFEYEPTMLHQKTMIVDGAWATVGTTNFDNRSFALSEETNICFNDRRLVADLQTQFDKDLADCKEVRQTEWRGRGLWQKMKEAVASLAEDQM